MTHVNLNVNVISSNVKAFQNANKDNLYYIKWVKLPFFSCAGSEGPDLLYCEVKVHISYGEQPKAQHSLCVPD